ncbi:MAG: hypothetical protein IH969_01425 [Candidatus Krumholzibacteriota bacterium]|nr:hypothetical protein [Candidatus Krumholzibacteriota bacterium]
MRSTTFVSWYRNIALVLLNTVLVLITINAILYVVILARYRWFHPARDNPVVQRYADKTWSEIYPGMREDSVYVLLDETWSRRQMYDPYTQFAERPYHGNFVNVSEHGFRVQPDQGPWPPDDRFYNVFLFGGSTAFGYGVTDDQALGACLQRALNKGGGTPVRVYNFGNASFSSSQERTRFEQLLFDGYVPDQAIFVDGLNEFTVVSATAETRRMRLLHDGGVRVASQWAFDALPMVRAGRAIERRVVAWFRPVGERPHSTVDAERTQRFVDRAVTHYLANQRMIEGAAEAYGISAVFVWEPIPMYKYDLSYHPFAEGGFPNNTYAQAGYENIARRIESGTEPANFIWCADMQETLREPLYIDKIHFSATMNRLLAQEIVSRMAERGLVRKR